MSNKPIIAGKKPVDSAATPLKYSNYQKNMLDIPEGIMAELKSKGYEGRWINYKQFIDDGNFHKEGWVPFKPEKMDAGNGFFFGQNPDGIIRRKELVLAYRPKEVCDAHRASLREKANRMSMTKKAAAGELRKMARDGNFNSNIRDDEGDEE